MRGSILLIDLRRPAGGPALARRGHRRTELRRDVPLPGERHAFELAVGVYGGDDLPKAIALARWSRSAGTPLVAVGVGPTKAIVGPLTLPRRVGCGECAARRMSARAYRDRDDSMVPDDSRPGSLEKRSLKMVRRVLAREIDPIETDGIEASQLVKAVLRVDAMRRALPGTCSSHYRIARRAAVPLRSLTSGERLGALDGWVDELTGIIPSLALDRRAGDEQLPVVVTAAPPHVYDDEGSLRRLPIGWGKGLTPDEALRSALGEAVERYSASLPDPDGRLATARRLSGRSTRPAPLPLYGESQYRKPDFPYVGSIRPGAIRGSSALARVGDGRLGTSCYGLSLLDREPGEHDLPRDVEWVGRGQRSRRRRIERGPRTRRARRLHGCVADGAHATPITLDDSLDHGLRKVLQGLESLGAGIELLLLPKPRCGFAIACLGLGDGNSWPG